MWTLLSDALLWSLALDTAVAWLPPLRHVRVDTWLWCLVILSLVGAVTIVLSRNRMSRADAREPNGVPFPIALATGIIFSFYAIIALVRPNVEWDAVNYYLFTAVGFSVSGHVDYFLPHVLTIADKAPMSLPPVMPTLYAVAIDLASALHVAADQVVRWIPLALLFGTWASARRLAQVFLRAPYPDLAAILFLTLPALTLYMTFNPLYVDLALAFLLCTLLADIATGNDSWNDGLRVGVTCALAILTKVTGLPILCMLLLVALTFWIGGVRGRILYGIAIAASGVLAWRLGLLGNALAAPTLCAAVIAIVLVYVAIPRHAEGRLPHWQFVGALALGMVSSLYVVLRTSQLVGSLLSFYAPGLAHILSPNWEWAWRTIRSLAVYDVSAPPGSIQNAAWGLILWWGFAPVTNIVACFGFIISLRRQLPIRSLGALFALYALAWLTVFHSNQFHNAFQFREFLALGFIEPIFAAYALSVVFETNAVGAGWAAGLLMLFAVPFAWVAQETFFWTPQGVLDRFGFNQWLALSNDTLRNAAVFSCVGLVLLFALWNFGLRRTLNQGWDLTQRALIVCCALLFFFPVIRTAVSPGFRVQYQAVRNTQVYGYLPALDAALSSSNESILTFVGYGVSWYSAGRERAVDLTDALALGLLKANLGEDNPSKTLQTLRSVGISAAILPIPDSNFGAAFQKLTLEDGMSGLRIFDDPLLTRDKQYGSWNYAVLYDPTTMQSGQHQLVVKTLRGSLIDATEPFERFHSASIMALLVGMPVGRIASGVLKIEAYACSPGPVCQSSPSIAVVSVAKPGRSVNIPFADLIRMVGLRSYSNNVARKVLLRSIELGLFDAAGRSEGVIDWRSSRFVIDSRGTRVTLDPNSAPFTAFPEYAPIGAVNVILARSSNRPLIYPSLSRNRASEPSAVGLSLALRSGPLCPQKERLLVSVYGTTRFKGKKTWLSQDWEVQRVSHADAYAWLPLPAGARAQQPGATVNIQRVFARGADTRCLVAEKLDAGKVTFVNRGGAWELSPNAAPLVLESLDIKAPDHPDFARRK